MNKIFYRYIARSFWGPFGFGLAVFCLLLLFGSLFDKLNFFMKGGSDGWLLARYMFYQAPYFAVKMAPLATLLAALSALGGMMATGEWKAGLAGGWKPFDMIKPLLVCSALVGAGQFLLQETAAPGMYMRAENLFEERVRGRDDWQRLVRRDAVFSAGPETFVSALLFDGRTGEMQGVVAGFYRGGRLWREVNASAASWNAGAGRWDLYDGAILDYGAGGEPAFTRFKTLRSELAVPPGNIVLGKLVPDGISIFDLSRRLRLLEAAGSPSAEERTLFWAKLAAPLANPAMALIGAAMVLLSGKSSRYMNFGLSVGLGFFFWAVIIMSQEAGNSELLPPLAAGFAPALLFAAASLWGLRRSRSI